MDESSHWVDKSPHWPYESPHRANGNLQWLDESLQLNRDLKFSKRKRFILVI